MPSTLTEIVTQLRSCNYECEAGALANNVAFQELERMAAAEQARWEPVPNGTYPGSDPQMGSFTISDRMVYQQIHDYSSSILLPKDWRIFRRTGSPLGTGATP